jgi:predicted nucleic acid-binding protein
MTLVTTDTSFLFSLFGNDNHTAAAQAWAREAGLPIALTPLNRYEFGNAVRFAAFRKAILPADAHASLAAFEADLKSGCLQLAALDSDAVIAEATRLSELFTAEKGHRSFDILHISAARLLKATTFLTFDANQRKLGAAVGLAVGP